MKNILVTIDFDIKTTLLIDNAYKLANVFDSKIWLVHIAAPDPDFVGYDIGPQYIRDSRAHELREEHKQLQDYAKELNEKNIEAEGLLIQGATIEMIIQESKKFHIDLIIAGHHKHNFLYNAFIESVSRGIIEASKIPILIIPYE
jgi:nucleotide-binding universal stress UspA family protein